MSDGTKPDTKSATKPKDDGASTQEPAEAVVRPSEAAEVPARHEGPSGERKGKGDPAVQAGADQQVDEGPDSRSGQPSLETVVVDVHLGGPTAYTDYPDIPERLAVDFKIHVFPPHSANTILHPTVDPSIYDGELVSDTIRRLGVWEVPETITLLSAFKAARASVQFVDIGCHVGWFSMLAKAMEMDVVAIDGDPRCLQALERSWADAGGYDILHPLECFIKTGWQLHIEGDEDLIVKIDVEGHENDAFYGMHGYFADHRVSHCLMEVSPVFGDYYPDLLAEVFDLGYRGYVMPRKVPTPAVVGDVSLWLARAGRRLDFLDRRTMKQWVAKQHQFNVMLTREGAQWG